MLASLLLTTALLVGGTEPDTTVRLPRGGTVEIDAHMRNVILRSGTSDVVTVRGGNLEQIGRNLAISENGRLLANGAAIEVLLPSWARVTVNTFAGNITVEGAPDRLDVESFQGSIRVTGGTGVLELQTMAGGITVNDFKGTRLNAEAVGEDVTVTNATGRIEVTSVNGTVRLRGIRSQYVEAGSVSGAVEFEGPLAADGRYNFESHAGGVVMTLAADASAQLHIEMFSGKFITQIPATRSGGRNDDFNSEFTAVIGKGGAQVHIDSFSGNVQVLKAGAPR